jgi:cytochrome c-type biogenesis protein CcmE
VKRKSQRLTLLLVTAAVLLAAALLAMSALRQQASYFYAPGDVARDGIPLGRAVRIGGMVQKGSIRREKDGVTIGFTVRDETPSVIQVRFRGITPDLFREDSGVVAEGRFQPDGLFVADEILARHDANYRPPELDAGRHQHKTDKVE